MKINQYGFVFRGRARGAAINLSIKDLYLLDGYKFSYLKKSYLFIYKHDCRMFYMEFKKSSILVRLYLPNQGRPILSYEQRGIAYNKASKVFGIIITNINKMMKNRARNLTEISEITSFLGQITDRLLQVSI